MWVKPEEVKDTGWYWHKDRFGEYEVVRIRMYGGKLAIANCNLIGGYSQDTFNGPILIPEEA